MTYIRRDTNHAVNFGEDAKELRPLNGENDKTDIDT